MRCAIFIDGAYLAKITRDLGAHATPDPQKLTHLILPKGHDLLRTRYYDCHPYAPRHPQPDQVRLAQEKERLFAGVRALPRHEVRLGAVVRRGEEGHYTYHQKQVDTMISVDIVEAAVSGQVQTIVLFAGDADFKPAIEAAKRHGVLTVLWSGPRHTTHEDLAQLADEHHAFSRGTLVKLGLVDSEAGAGEPEARLPARTPRPARKRSNASSPKPPSQGATRETNGKRKRRGKGKPGWLP